MEVEVIELEVRRMRTEMGGEGRKVDESEVGRKWCV